MTGPLFTSTRGLVRRKGASDDENQTEFVIGINGLYRCSCCLRLEAALSSDNTYRSMGQNEFARTARCRSVRKLGRQISSRA
jgi:hypothetical protein